MMVISGSILCYNSVNESILYKANNRNTVVCDVQSLAD